MPQKKDEYCVETGPFGFGPFTEGGLVVCPPSPPGRGYGEEALYGFSPYGSGGFPKPPFPPEYGYGADAYGYGAYGTADIEGPKIASVVSVSGTEIHAYFSEPVFVDHLLLKESWEILADFGGDPQVLAVATLGEPIRGMDPSTAQTGTLILGVRITHTGTVLGGRYRLVAQLNDGTPPWYFRDQASNAAMEPHSRASFLALGEIPEVVVTPLAGNKIHVAFSRDMGVGLDDVGSYAVSLDSDYPITPVVQSATPLGPREAMLQAPGMTTLEYDLVAGPAEALEYHPSKGLPGSGSYELGSGESYVQEETPSTPAYLLLNKEAGAPYGWHFSEVSDDPRLKEDCVFRLDFEMDASLAVWDPVPVNGAVFGIHFSDGDVQLSLIFGRVDGEDKLTLSSGALNLSVSCGWSLTRSTVSLLRNQLTGHWAVLWGGQPLISLALADVNGGPTMSAGVQFVLASNIGVSGMPILGVDLTASSTLYAGDGNFVHEVNSMFLGLGDLTLDTLKTSRGPLTKGWGDSRPATVEDVTVRVNGQVVELADVNPYIGKVKLQVPVPRMPADDLSVEVDYKWFPTARMEMAGLNKLGLVLNKWDIRSGRNASSKELRDGGGSREGERFPMCLALGQAPEWNPRWISHRHIGFEQAYTASLNDPTSLKLNINPHLYAPKREAFEQTAFSSSFEGQVAGTWTLQDVTFTPLGDGYGSIASSRFGGASVGVPLALSPSAMTITARTRISKDPLPPTGFHIGPILGFHDNDRLKVAAAIIVAGLEHFALLQGEDPTEESSWKIGPSSTATLLHGGQLDVPAGYTPPLFAEGHRLQIRSGVQAGVYECLAREDLSDGGVRITVDRTFPADIDTWEAGSAQVLFETLWSKVPFTWSLVASSGSAGMSLVFSGEIAGSVGTLVEGPPVDSIPSTLVDMSLTGEVLWGHQLTNQDFDSEWSFVRYVGIPDQQRQSSIGHVVTAEMSDLPEESGEWWRNSPIGTAEVLGDGSVLIRAEAEAGIGGHAVGYERVDPLIPDPAVIEVQGRLKSEGPGSGWGDAGFFVKGPTHDVLVSTLLYVSSGGNQLLSMPSVSLAGDLGPVERGWEPGDDNGLSWTAEGRVLRVRKDPSSKGALTKRLDLVSPFENGVSRQMEARLSLEMDASSTTEDVGLALTMDAGSPARLIALSFLAGTKRVALSSGGSSLLEVECDWSEEHTYRVVAQYGAEPTVTLYIDGVPSGSVPLLSFDLSSSNAQATFLSYGGEGWTLELSAFAVSVLPPTQSKRTLGIYKGGDKDDINSWVIPRSDIYGKALLNSYQEANLVEMDWAKDWVHVRLTIDPTWGVSLLRPDLPLPPTYSPTDQATEFSNPSAAWCSLEWNDVPLFRDPHARFGMGSLRGSSVSSVAWDFFKYRVFIGKDEGIPVLRGAILNRYNVITSGELGQDLTVDEARIPVRDALIDLRKGHISAQRIFSISVGDFLVPKTEWSFDHDTQIIKLSDSVADGYEAHVKFSPGAPVTSTYLKNQPLRDGVTNLNEGTPPMSWSRSRPWLRGYLPASRINEITDTLNIDDDFVLNDPLGTVAFGNHPSDLYADISFMEIEDNGSLGRISSIDDGPAPGKGFAGLELEGRMVHGWAWKPILRPDFDQRGGSMGGLLHAAGGGFKHTGVLGGGKVHQGSPTWPSKPAAPSEPNPGAAELQTRWDIREVREEVFPQAEPDGSYREAKAGPYSRIGPWGGEDALIIRSFLYGGHLPESGVGMVLEGGASLPPPEWSFGILPK
jgi:hypothetical protein